MFGHPQLSGPKSSGQSDVAVHATSLHPSRSSGTVRGLVFQLSGVTSFSKAVFITAAWPGHLVAGSSKKNWPACPCEASVEVDRGERAAALDETNARDGDRDACGGVTFNEFPTRRDGV